ncbi:component of IIS longevity pathway SMK-1-domain-containing protein [Calycina marina]|uniref:Component of IIS longevity pathway SMK-1-domain-containing protein n=1 Tax=Calycina marina TaxID=1763456 RepID=A0A9P8CFK6_9HELO|nr:component of IIS longevity pathway SMK-1-domain-containing protein [Calycina marina]
MALSFQEGDGCAAIWKYIHNVQQQLSANGGAAADDTLSDDGPMDGFQNVLTVPPPGLANLHEIENQMRGLSNTNPGRGALARFILEDDYIRKLTPLLDMAEDLEDLASLHRLCNIMKFVILLNESAIIESAVADDLILGVVGALEYDPDFPSHKANHRQWLGKEGRYKEVVRIDDDVVCRKIHQTYRLQYLKDVVLARILDDPTFSVLNSLIFFNQVDIVTHLQMNSAFLKELFGIFGQQEANQDRKKEAVLFIQQCCAIAKNLQPAGRNQLYSNFLGHGLLSVITYALRHNDVEVRVGATDVLVSMIDHDPQVIRQTIFRQMSEKQVPLTDSLIDLLLVEADLGVKAHIADAIKVLLDPGPSSNQLNREAGELGGRMRPQYADPEQEGLVKDFYDESAKKLFKPLVDLKDRGNLDFSIQEVSLFIYLIEILCFFVRQHQHRSKYFVLSEKLGQRIAQLLASPEKYLKLTALKFFRNLVGLKDEFYNQEMMQGHLFGPILSIVTDTMSRDSLLNSACLELFEFIRKETIRPLISHLVADYREKLRSITYVSMFNDWIIQYDATNGFQTSLTESFPDTEEDTPKRPETGRGSRWDNGIKDLDDEEEAYFNTSDDEDEIPASLLNGNMVDGASPASKPLVDYNSDEENDAIETVLSAGILPSNGNTPESISTDGEVLMTPTSSGAPSPLDNLSEKRRREEDDEDELGKLLQHKRRNSSSSASSNNSSVLRRKKTFGNANTGVGHIGKTNKIAISLSPAIKLVGEKGGEANCS